MPKFQQFALPDVGEGLTEADIVTWHVAVGDTVSVNQTIVEIETAKSLVELPCPWDGVVTRLLVEPGQTVDVGTPIVVVDVDPAGPADAADPAPADASAAAPAASAASEGSEASSEGSGDVLVGYGTRPAASARRPRTTGGAASGGTTATAASGRTTATAASGAASGGPAAGSDARPTPGLRAVPAVGGAPTRPPAVVTPPASAATPSSSTHLVLAKPPVRKLAKDLGIDLTTVTPSGPGGIVTRGDVLARSQGNEPRQLATYPGDDKPWLADGSVSDDGRQTRVPVRSVRRRTAEAMVASAFTAPHVTVFRTVDVSRTMELVAQLRSDREFEDVRVTPLLITAKALILAIRRHPEISASWDDETQEIVYKHYINLGIAAATRRGLVVPNIKDAHRLTLHELAGEIAALTQTAREGKTTPVGMSDGTATITNIGVFGIDAGTPILNPGESAILALGAIEQRPWVHDGELAVRWVTQLALSFDHRLVDGELGSRVLADVARVLEDPARGLVWG
ncbi:catalytic domain of components of various dehydrogenase complexes [Beutenbergia cavernae DSM 12333]|uniref:Dihydrolipoamide acetyltransferase component of pyruvate dehydrogenase complex n=1 Tax=Beutenbergia cavernae (strain ATCC BAA-8 / DSM 12333 / CCUG 43141 / JCM 11478 / NBRC 16432 / NCIMB 13614 / HKI 0122) TaxID=471853 RepID=C5C566_BEUC1|nr:dihydrolipoamide acetyltransferase family protein [Beutenbergia cavernae]ACQ82206.1 catalytic domain of components of various dehydrogenase complexes [Beutenbergia cavernae DSM 12333]